MMIPQQPGAWSRTAAWAPYRISRARWRRPGFWGPSICYARHFDWVTSFSRAATAGGWRHQIEQPRAELHIDSVRDVSGLREGRWLW